MCRPPRHRDWRSPLIALDVDGVLDRRLLGFPCTTAAGVEALSILNDKGLTITLNTARSAVELREYCSAYSLSGGVAEYGSYIWDALLGRERVLISAEAVSQLAQLRRHLRQIPGVFLDERHQYSIRAFTYESANMLRSRGRLATVLASMRPFSIGQGAPVPLNPFLVRNLIAELALDQLELLETSVDSTVIAKRNNKGSGLAELRDWVLGPEAETVAVGDSEPDLAMFRVATRSYAPSHIGCAGMALLLGCRIARRDYQRGLLEIARLQPTLIEVPRKSEPATIASRFEREFFETLSVADTSTSARLARALTRLSTFRSVFG